MFAKLPSDLTIEASIEERVGSEGEVANPSNHILSLLTRQIGAQCRIEMKGEIGQPAKEKLSSHSNEDEDSFSTPKRPLGGSPGGS